MSNRYEAEELEFQLKELKARKKELKAKRKEEKKYKRSKGRSGIGILCAIFAMLTIGLSVTLFFSIRQSLIKMDTLESEKTNLRNNLQRANLNVEALEERCESYSKELATAKTTINSLRSENESLKKKLFDTDPDNVKYAYSFESVSALVSAIKKNPKEYNNKQVKIVGTAFKMKIDSTMQTYLLDLSSTDDLSDKLSNEFDVRYYIWLEQKNETGKLIDIKIADDVLSTVLGSGDYIKLYGTIRIANDEIYLDKCDYERITAYK